MKKSAGCLAVMLSVALLALLLCACGSGDTAPLSNSTKPAGSTDSRTDTDIIADNGSGQESSGDLRAYRYVGFCDKNGVKDSTRLCSAYSNNEIVIRADHTATFKYLIYHTEGTVENDTFTGIRNYNGEKEPVELYCKVTDDYVVIEDPYNFDETPEYLLLEYNAQLTERRSSK